jgi:large subunit ribosomal protein L18
MALSKRERRIRIRRRIRKKVEGTVQVPRLSVFRSNKHIYVQLINDIDASTILSASSSEKEIEENSKLKKIAIAELVGKKIAERAKEKNILNVVFDRGGYKYHGRVKALAESARKEGLKF